MASDNRIRTHAYELFAATLAHPLVPYNNTQKAASHPTAEWVLLTVFFFCFQAYYSYFNAYSVGQKNTQRRLWTLGELLLLFFEHNLAGYLTNDRSCGILFFVVGGVV